MQKFNILKFFGIDELHIFTWAYETPIWKVNRKANKDVLLLLERGFMFQDIIKAIEDWHLIDIVENHNPKYPWQHKLIVYLPLINYIVSVPYKQEWDMKHLITAYPDRKENRTFRSQ